MHFIHLGFDCRETTGVQLLSFKLKVELGWTGWEWDVFYEVSLLSLSYFFWRRSCTYNWSACQGAEKRKIEVPADSQPQLELGDTAEEKERRREREER